MIESRERHARVRRYNDGITNVTFGDGIRGTRLPVAAIVIIAFIAVAAISGIFLFTRRDNKPPVIVLRANSTKVEKNAPIQFSAGDSTDNVKIVSYHWDFGDGTTETGEDVVHAYSEVGDFTVTLTVADKAGNEEKDTMMIEVRLGAY